MVKLVILPVRAASRQREIPPALQARYRDAALGSAAFLAIAGLAAADGGYFPSAWGWSCLAFLWAAMIALFLRSRVHTGFQEGVLLAALAALALWTGLSYFWSEDVSQTMLEVERSLVYFAGLVAFCLLVRQKSVAYLLVGILTAITAVSAYALANRLFPERFGAFDPLGLSEPLGYTNALGLFAGLGAILAFGTSTQARSLRTRVLAAATLPILMPTLYFTFSRGPWLALGLGLAALIALDHNRLRLITSLFFLAPAPALAVFLSSRSDALTRASSPLAAASREGHRLALTILLLAAVSALVALFLTEARESLNIGRAIGVVFVGTLLLVAAIALSIVFARYGGPITLVNKGYDAFQEPAPELSGDANRAFFTFSGSWRADFWRIGWEDARAHPWLGSGAGTYEQYWHQHRPMAVKVRDAHSVYVETLAELGPVGLILLLTALGVPLVAAVSARRQRLVPAAFGAYVAYLFHAGIEWDWEMTVITLTGLFCGAALVVAARHREARPLSRWMRAGALLVSLALSAFVFVGLMGNSTLAASEEALERGNLSEAATEARTARRWMPWSSGPWEALAQVQLARDDFVGARTSLRRAIAKDPRDWSLWLDLALVSQGSEARRALARAHELNPLSPEIAEVRGRVK